MDVIASPPAWFDYGAVMVFAATGALAAARQHQDIVTFGFFAAVTGVGGGTLRDLLIGAPVFWVARPGYLIACLLAAAAVWTLGPGRARLRILLWLDALGLAAYCVLGAAKAEAQGVPALSAMIMGVLTACFGGVIRDVLAHQPSVLLRRELYVTCAVSGAGAFVTLRMIGLPLLPAGLVGFALALAVRAGAIALNWSLVGYHEPGAREG